MKFVRADLSPAFLEEVRQRASVVTGVRIERVFPYVADFGGVLGYLCCAHSDMSSRQRDFYMDGIPAAVVNGATNVLYSIPEDLDRPYVLKFEPVGYRDLLSAVPCTSCAAMH